MINSIFRKALALEFISVDEALVLYEKASLGELMSAANELRMLKVPGNEVTWIIDRNVNITNICISRCKFCNFHRIPKDNDTFVTTLEQYREKIEELYAIGGRQLLLQGGLHPNFGLTFYSNLFKALKSMYPDLKLHALGPAEIVHIARLEQQSYRQILEQLVEAGLDSLPGAGAEILCDRVRMLVSPGKCNSQQWLDVVREAHKMNLLTSATMMFGHAETVRERFEHVEKIRQVQSEKPTNAYGFMAFILWPFMDEGTRLKELKGIQNTVTNLEYIRMLAISRLMLPNINNIQASWLTVGAPIGQLCLHAGANDMGSIMIEENVVSAAGADFKMDVAGMQQTIREAGFTPRLRNQQYKLEPDSTC